MVPSSVQAEDTTPVFCSSPSHTAGFQGGDGGSSVCWEKYRFVFSGLQFAEQALSRVGEGSFGRALWEAASLSVYSFCPVKGAVKIIAVV